MSIEAFYRIISEFSKVPVDEITENSSFRDDLGIDSLQMVNLILEVSNRHNLDLQSVQSIDALSKVGSMYKTLYKGEMS